MREWGERDEMRSEGIGGERGGEGREERERRVSSWEKHGTARHEGRGGQERAERGGEGIELQWKD